MVYYYYSSLQLVDHVVCDKKFTRKGFKQCVDFCADRIVDVEEAKIQAAPALWTVL